mmetsp:Transcript_96571/g.282277  ORF Transcript_96571/g.282277 Transcript_96571/m.282277 type:complete len:127 (+) Transcript_96571:169-549(+)
MICSAERSVDKRCAIMIVVQVCCAAAARSSVRTSPSVLESSEAVPSSINKIGGLLSSARAMATRCFSPPLSLSPRSPTTVSRPLGSPAATESRAAPRMALCTSSAEAAGSPYSTFSYRVALKSTTS